MMSRRKQEKSLLNYIDSDYFKMIFTDECVFKIVKKNRENDVQIKKVIKLH